MSHRNGYIPTLDGWRGLSVISVVLYHGRFGFFKSDPLLMKLSSHGNIGVDVFFAISGFLICGLLLHEYARDGSISLRRFYIRRCFRILPAYYVALAGIAALAMLVITSGFIVTGQLTAGGHTVAGKRTLTLTR